MSILVDDKTRVVVQGIKERGCSFRQMVEYGTKVVAGVTQARADRRSRHTGLRTVSQAVKNRCLSDLCASSFAADAIQRQQMRGVSNRLPHRVNARDGHHQKVLRRRV
jgi:succinyl-CoA synthetase alpha subunit